MLTVKLVEYNGHEQIFEARNVWAEDAPEYGDRAKKVFAAKPFDDDPLVFSGFGAVYVMNSEGATVAKYWLGDGNTGCASGGGKG